MEFVNFIPNLLASVGSFIVALAAAALIKNLGDFISKLQV